MMKNFVPKRERIVGKFKHDFEERLYRLNEINNINAGGCGVAAVAIYRFLTQNGLYSKYLSFAFAYKGWDASLYESNLNKHNNGNYDELEVPSHVVLKFKNKFFIDSNGYDTDPQYDLFHDVSHDEVLINVNHSGWNWIFDRRKEIPKIEKILNVNLSDIDLTVSD